MAISSHFLPKFKTAFISQIYLICNSPSLSHTSMAASRPVFQFNNGDGDQDMATGSFLHHPTSPTPSAPPPPPPMAAGEEKKRPTRNRYTQEQKMKMIRFAEKLGWRPEKHDQEEIENFCLELGISCRIFRIWVNNNRRRRDMIYNQRCQALRD